MYQRYRTVLAILVAPAAPTLMILVPQLLHHATLDLADQSAKLVVLAVLAASYAVSYTLGIPVYLFARRRHWRTAQQYMGAAFLMGLAAVPVIDTLLLIRIAILRSEAFLPAASELWSRHALGLTLGPIAIGCLAAPIGLLFWLIARSDRPA
jgi:hypothetical protein